MEIKYLKEDFIRIIDELPDEAIRELLEYIFEKRDIKTKSILPEANLEKVLSEDAELLKRLSELPVK